VGVKFLDEAPVVVIGSGLAGLTAAWQIHRSGQEVIVLEVAEKVGGRTIRSDDGWHGKQHANLGGELIHASYRALRSVCLDLGVELTSPRAYGKSEPDDGTAMEGFLRTARFVVGGQVLTPQHCQEIGTELRAAVRDVPPAEHEIVEQWIRRARLSSAAAGVTRGVARFFTQLDPWDCDAYFISGPANGTFQRIRGGTVELALALARDLDVRLGRRVLRVERGQTSRVTVEDGEQFSASRVVCAVGPFAVASIGFDPPLSDEKVMAATSLLPAMAGKVMVQYAEGDAVREAFGSLVCTDGPIGSAWVSVLEEPAGTPGIVTAFVAGADRGLMRSEEAAFAMVDDLVAQIVGGPATRLHGEIKNWWADPFAMGVTVAPAATARGPIAAVLGALELETHFAGDYTDASMAGTLEGAVRSGMRAAAEVLRTTTPYHTDHVTERLSRS